MKCVVIGIGHVALQRYLPALAGQPDVEIACCSRNIDSARLGAERFEAQVLADLDDVFRWRPDVAFVVTPDTTHVQIVGELIAQGVPRILVEKPLASAGGQTRIDTGDLDDGLALARAAAERGVEVAVAYNYRHFETVARARDEIARRGWSPASGVAASTHYACLSHVVDLISVFLGELEAVAALRGTDEIGAGKFHVEDRVVAFTAESGATGVLRASAGQPWGDRLFDLALSYPEGSVRLTDLDGTLDLFDAVEGRRIRFDRPDERSRADGYEASFASSIAAYLDAVRAGRRAPSTIEDGVRELRFHSAVARSIASGMPVRVAD